MCDQCLVGGIGVVFESLCVCAERLLFTQRLRNNTCCSFHMLCLFYVKAVRIQRPDRSDLESDLHLALNCDDIFSVSPEAVASSSRPGSTPFPPPGNTRYWRVGLLHTCAEFYLHPRRNFSLRVRLTQQQIPFVLAQAGDIKSGRSTWNNWNNNNNHIQMSYLQIMFVHDWLMETGRRSVWIPLR